MNELFHTKIHLSKKIFLRCARKHLDEIRLFFRGDRLSKKEGDWNNVIDHCLVQGAEVEKEVFSLLKEKGVAIDAPEDIPKVINEHIQLNYLLEESSPNITN